jgi:N-acyl-D-amino-acid deacylase
MIDLLIHNGEVLDGTGGPSYRADVAVDEDRIVEIGLLEGAQAATILDATGCVVAPGFVDVHSHADFVLPLLPTADSLVHQGITTLVVGQCGASPVPLSPDTRDEAIASMESEDLPLPWELWSTFASYLDYLRELGTAPNVVPLVGQGAVRSAVMGFTAAPADADQIAAMQAEVIQAMEAGAIGISTGLIYPPGSYARTEELVEVVRPAGERGGFYFSHIRGEGETLLEAIAEAIHIGRETGAAVEISHLKAAGRANWHKAPAAIALIEEARAEGLDITADMYPYPASNTGLTALLPQAALEGGKAATLARLADPAARAAMSETLRNRRTAEWDKIIISESPHQRETEGRSIAELAEAVGQDPAEWVCDALLATELDVSIILFSMSEENVAAQMGHPAVMFGTDSSGRSVTGPLSRGVPHPRNYGTYPRVLGHYVRERKVLSLTEAVHKMTGLPAEKLRWTHRGLVRKGYAADLVVFDPATVIDRATYREPHQYPAGIRHVLVNGRPVIRDGKQTEERPGRILERA